jgi:hypothetical protein
MKSRSHLSLLSFLICLTMLLLMLAGCSEPPATILPAQVLGEWQTDDARYRGRGMKLDSNRVIFGLGGVAADKAELVESVKMTPKDNPTDLLIQLRTADGTPDSLALQYTAANGGELRIKSQAKIVWRRGNAFTRAVPSTPEPSKPAPEVTAAPPVPAGPAVQGDRIAPSRPAAPKGRKHPVLVRSDGTQDHQVIYLIDCLHPGDCESY